MSQINKIKIDGCLLGHNDFHNLMDSPARICQIKMFVKNVFHVVKPFLANLHSTSSKKYPFICIHMQ